ncbi:hypothetical protein EDB83DRAFT_2320041 [Lactarius deliciosus]|nr:hypothetical protein EDB83DRAFT_2320041 [Lactarius deliciosus]
MSLPLSNATYVIKNVGVPNNHIALPETRPGTTIILADHGGNNEWLLRDQGYGGDDLQMVSLQYKDDLGFFAAPKQGHDVQVKYDKHAWTVKLEDISDDNVMIRYTKGGKNLVLSAKQVGHRYEVVLANRNGSDSKQLWKFEIV